jgi:uncharacterized delta-60 repeat protein
MSFNSTIASGMLDTTFNSTGTQTHQLGNWDSMIADIDVQSDGKIVAVGSSNDTNFSNITVCRYRTNGSLDHSFGLWGVWIMDVAGDQDYGAEIVATSSGKILVAGVAKVSSLTDIVIYRLNDDGSLDSTFGLNGMSQIDIAVHNETISGMHIQSNGRIIVTGFTSGSSGWAEYYAVRVNTNGVVDSSYGTNGRVMVQIGSSLGFARDSEIDGNDRVVIVGDAKNGTDDNFAALRLLNTGELDTTFGNGGTTVFQGGPGTGTAWAVAIQDDNSIVMGGYSALFPAYYLVLRLNEDGSRDTTFGAAGEYKIDGSLTDLVLQSDGKIVGGGNGSGPQFSTFRLHSSGNADYSFGSGGYVQRNILFYDEVNTVAVQPDGKILAAGLAQNDTGPSGFAIERYLSSNTTGILSAQPTPLIDVYPNPSTGSVNVTVEGVNTWTLRVHDLLGRTVYREENISSSTHQIDRLKEGMYVLQVVRGGKVVAVGKFVVKR